MYATAAAFKTALEQRLRDSSKSGVELARRRQLLVFDRLDCARHARARKAAMLKGGLVLELRLETARTTRDVDCALSARRRPFHWRKRHGRRAAGGTKSSFGSVAAPSIPVVPQKDNRRSLCR